MNLFLRTRLAPPKIQIHSVIPGGTASSRPTSRRSNFFDFHSKVAGLKLPAGSWEGWLPAAQVLKKSNSFFDFHSKVAGLRSFRKPFVPLCENFNGELTSDSTLGKIFHTKIKKNDSSFEIHRPETPHLLLGGAASSRPGSRRLNSFGFRSKVAGLRKLRQQEPGKTPGSKGISNSEKLRKIITKV